MDVIVKTITIEEFVKSHKSFTRAGAGKKPEPSDQLQVLRNMDQGDALVLSHAGLACRRKANPGEGNYCSLGGMAQVEGRRRNLRFSIRHLPDGTVAVVCLERRAKARS